MIFDIKRKVVCINQINFPIKKGGGVYLLFKGLEEFAKLFNYYFFKTIGKILPKSLFLTPSLKVTLFPFKYG
jgi:hypothetical protein